MSNDAVLAEFDIRGGDRLTLYANRVVRQGGDELEVIPLAQLASVRVAFVRQPARLAWAIGLLVVALMVAVATGPLQRGIAASAAKYGDPSRPESLDALLLAIFNFFGAIASLLPALAAALAAGGAALFVYYWLGGTTLTLAFAASERACAVRGRNRALVQFAEAIGDRLAERTG
jgi:hypothetical protein